jgi:hypothetical protein
MTRSPVKPSAAAVKTSQSPTKSISSTPSKIKTAIVLAIGEWTLTWPYTLPLTFTRARGSALG